MGRYWESCRLPEAYRAIAMKYQVHFLDASELTGVSKLDGVHLTREGHRILGNAIAKEIQRILQKDAEYTEK